MWWRLTLSLQTTKDNTLLSRVSGFVNVLSIGNSIVNENNSQQQQRSTNNIKNNNTTKLYFVFQQLTNQNKSKGCQVLVNEVFMNFR